MIYTIVEYAEKFRFKGKKVSPMTIKRRCEKGQLPSGHIAKKLPGQTGAWLITVEDEIENSVNVKEEPKFSLSHRHINWSL